MKIGRRVGLPSRPPGRMIHRAPLLPLMAAVLPMLLSGVCSAQPVRLLTTQFAPLPEQTIFRSRVLKDFPAPVVLNAIDDTSVYVGQARRLAAAGPADLVYGGLYQDFLRLRRAGVLGSLRELDGPLGGGGADARLIRRSRLGTNEPRFVPWMTATYLLAANRRALPYLPRGAKLDHLTYEQLLEWAKNMYRATGEPKLGFPAGPKGLFDRFLEGYLYPSFTGKVASVDGPGAPPMWRYLRSLWKYVTPSSFIFNRMSEPLLDGQVWVAWDHTARLLRAFKKRPAEFVAFPAPAGPAGRGYVSVVAGLGLPPGHPSSDAARLISYLTSPRVEGLTLRNLGFLPARPADQIPDLSASLRTLLRAARQQEDSPSSIRTTMPPLATADAAAFDLAYLESFSRIVLRKRPIDEVLPAAAKRIRSLRDGVAVPLPQSSAPRRAAAGGAP